MSGSRSAGRSYGRCHQPEARTEAAPGVQVCACREQHRADRPSLRMGDRRNRSQEIMGCHSDEVALEELAELDGSGLPGGASRSRVMATPLANLAMLTLNSVHLKSSPSGTFMRTAPPTPVRRRAFELLDLVPGRVGAMHLEGRNREIRNQRIEIMRESVRTRHEVPSGRTISFATPGRSWRRPSPATQTSHSMCSQCREALPGFQARSQHGRPQWSRSGRILGCPSH